MQGTCLLGKWQGAMVEWEAGDVASIPGTQHSCHCCLHPQVLQLPCFW